MAIETTENLTNSVFTPLLISGTAIAVTAIAILVYHFIILRFCLNRERHRRVVFGSESVHDEKQLNQGLDMRILNKIPTIRYSSSARKDGGDAGGGGGGQPPGVDQSECAICLAEFEENVVVRVLPRCGHAFHVECVDEWLSFHTNCPVCRSPVCPIVISEVPLCVEDPDGHDRDHYRDRERVDEERRRFDLPLVRSDQAHDRVDVQDKTRGVVLGLKRSFSMDQSHVLIDMLQRKSDDKKGDPSSSSSSKECLGQSRSYTARFDRMSSVLTMSFSQLRMGRTNSISNMANELGSTDPS